MGKRCTHEFGRRNHKTKKGKMVLTATKKDRANYHNREKALPFLVAKRYKA